VRALIAVSDPKPSRKATTVERRDRCARAKKTSIAQRRLISRSRGNAPIKGFVVAGMGQAADGSPHSCRTHAEQICDTLSRCGNGQPASTPVGWRWNCAASDNDPDVDRTSATLKRLVAT